MLYIFAKTINFENDFEYTLMSNNEGAVKSFSAAPLQFAHEMTKWVESSDRGRVITNLFGVFGMVIKDPMQLANVKQQLDKWERIIPISVGVAPKIFEAYQAMVFAEAHSIHSIVFYDSNVEEYFNNKMEDELYKSDDENNNAPSFSLPNIELDDEENEDQQKTSAASKKKILEVLVELKEKAPAIAQLKQVDPSALKTINKLVEALGAMIQSGLVKSETLEKAWPKDEAENKANREGFYTQHPAQWPQEELDFLRQHIQKHAPHLFPGDPIQKSQKLEKALPKTHAENEERLRDESILNDYKQQEGTEDTTQLKQLPRTPGMPTEAYIPSPPGATDRFEPTDEAMARTRAIRSPFESRNTQINMEEAGTESDSFIPSIDFNESPFGKRYFFTPDRERPNKMWVGSSNSEWTGHGPVNGAYFDPSKGEFSYYEGDDWTPEELNFLHQHIVKHAPHLFPGDPIQKIEVREVEESSSSSEEFIETSNSESSEDEEKKELQKLLEWSRPLNWVEDGRIKVGGKNLLTHKPMPDHYHQGKAGVKMGSAGHAVGADKNPEE